MKRRGAAGHKRRQALTPIVVGARVFVAALGRSNEHVVSPDIGESVGFPRAGTGVRREPQRGSRAPRARDSAATNILSSARSAHAPLQQAPISAQCECCRHELSAIASPVASGDVRNRFCRRDREREYLPQRTPGDLDLAKGPGKPSYRFVHSYCAGQAAGVVLVLG